jgi:hypothetical protein
MVARSSRVNCRLEPVPRASKVRLQGMGLAEEFTTCTMLFEKPCYRPLRTFNVISEHVRFSVSCRLIFNKVPGQSRDAAIASCPSMNLSILHFPVMKTSEALHKLERRASKAQREQATESFGHAISARDGMEGVLPSPTLHR